MKTSENYKNKQKIIWMVFLFLLTFSISITNTSTNFNIPMKEISEQLANDFHRLEVEELGVDYIKKLYSTFKYISKKLNATERVDEIAKNFQTKIENTFSALLETKQALQDNFSSLTNNSTKTELQSYLFPCSNGDMDMDEEKNQQNFSNSYDSVLKNVVVNPKWWNIKDSVKQQYFISSWDVENSKACPFLNCQKIDHMLVWKQFQLRNQYTSKKIVILLDHGGSLSKLHFFLIKSIAKAVIETLNENDQISLVAISNNWSSPQLSNDCLISNKIPLVSVGNGNSTTNPSPTFFFANEAKKKLMYKFIDGLRKGTGATNHSLGIGEALKIVEENQVQNETVMILYISRGLLSSLTESKIVLEIILGFSKSLNSSIIINTCAVVDETRPPMYEIQFLKDIALQDYKKYNLSSKMGIPGNMIVVNSSDGVGYAVSNLLTMYRSKYFLLGEAISLPLWDNKSKDLTITFSVGIRVNKSNNNQYHHNQQYEFGIVGIDIYMEKLIEHLAFFCDNIKEKHQYAFLMDLEGRVIMHPSFACPTTVHHQLHYVDISYFELVPDINILRRRLLEEYSGKHVTTQFGSTINYTWKRIANWYVVCIVEKQSFELLIPYQIDWPFKLNINNSGNHNIKLIYQNLNKSRNANTCTDFHQVATLDGGSLYLSSSSFISSNHFADMNNQEQVDIYMAYIQDNRDLVGNPGLKDEIKDEIAALAYVLNYLRNQHLTSPKSRYIMRRYVATSSGILQMYPRSVLELEDSFEPRKRPWFIQANQHKSKLILTPPYLDEGGAGYIVTLAYATSHLVVAVDVTYGFIFRMLLKRIPDCGGGDSSSFPKSSSFSSSDSLFNITCFIMDDRGYLIYHPNLIDPNGHGPVEKQHIVHKESLVANDILNNQLFIKKMLCNSYGGNTMQRYYKLNTSFSQVLSNSVHGENCISYIISVVPGTNIFIGIVKASCNIVVTFCPCSIIDRLCFNCNRMEEKECECPCECPLEETKCYEENPNSNPICSWFPEHISYSFLTPFSSSPSSINKSCFPKKCLLEETYSGCLTLTGCEWCRYDVDGRLLKNPFCASLATCYNGVVGFGSVSSYQGSFDDNEEIPPSSLNLPISFIILFVLGVFIILCMFYIYHRSSSRSTPSITERLYFSSTQDNHLRMSDLNMSMAMNDNFHSVGNHRDKLLQDEKPDPISPYCVSSGYRRIALTADSDHGYSTMTQHDESEHMSLAPFELDSLELENEDDLESESKSDSESVSPSPSNIFTTNPKTKRSNQPFTCISPTTNHSILVPVTVHRNMETT